MNDSTGGKVCLFDGILDPGEHLQAGTTFTKAARLCVGIRDIPVDTDRVQTFCRTSSFGEDPLNVGAIRHLGVDHTLAQGLHGGVKGEIT